MTSDSRPGTFVSAFGAATFVCCVVIVAAYWLADAALFWRIVTILPGVFVLVTAAPYVYFTVTGLADWHDIGVTERTRRDVERQRLQAEARRLFTEGRGPVVEHAPARPAEDLHTRAWRHFLLLCAWEAVRVGSVAYQSMRGFFGDDHDKWRAFVDRLDAWGKSWPVQPGVETFLKPGQTPTLIFDLLTGGALPPLPESDPPRLEPRQQPDVSTVKTARKQKSTVPATVENSATPQTNWR